MPKDAVDSPLEYTKNRDIHSVGVILLQMLLGLDVMERYPDFHFALRNCESSMAHVISNCAFNPYIASISLPMQTHIHTMLSPHKKNVSPHSLLASMAGLALGNGVQRTPAISINGESESDRIHYRSFFDLLNRQWPWSEDATPLAI